MLIKDGSENIKVSINFYNPLIDFIYYICQKRFNTNLRSLDTLSTLTILINCGPTRRKLTESPPIAFSMISIRDVATTNRSN
jgi:hypothetical protein